MDSPFSTFGMLRVLLPRLASALVIGLCALILVAPATASQILNWAIRAEAAHITKRLQPLLDAPVARIERAQAGAYWNQQSAAQARALTRARQRR